MQKENHKECLNRFLGKCPKCVVDFDPTHHPNNYDCPMYKSVSFLSVDVEEKGYFEDSNDIAEFLKKSNKRIY